MQTNAALQLIEHIARSILNPLIELMFAGALVVFLWGVIEYILGADNQATRANGSRHIMWGIIGIFIMMSAFALLDLIGQTIGVGSPSQQIRLN